MCVSIVSFFLFSPPLPSIQWTDAIAAELSRMQRSSTPTSLSASLIISQKISIYPFLLSNFMQKKCVRGIILLLFLIPSTELSSPASCFDGRHKHYSDGVCPSVRPSSRERGASLVARTCNDWQMNSPQSSSVVLDRKRILFKSDL